MNFHFNTIESPVPHNSTVQVSLPATSLLTGKPISVICPPWWVGRVADALLAFTPRHLPPRAFHHADEVFPLRLLDEALALSATGQLQPVSKAQDRKIGRTLRSMRRCGREPSFMYTSPGTGFQICFPYCGMNSCKVCMLIDARKLVRRLAGHVEKSLASTDRCFLATLSFEQRPCDPLQTLYNDFSAAWAYFQRRIAEIGVKYVGALHIGVRRWNPIPQQVLFSWRLHFHVFFVCPRLHPNTAEAVLHLLWEEAVDATSGRSTVGTWSDEFKARARRTGVDTPIKSAVATLKYLFQGLLGPREAEERDGGVLLPIRDSPAACIREAVACICKPGFQRFRASRDWKKRPEIKKRKKTRDRICLRLFLRRRKNSIGYPVCFLTAFEYAVGIKKLLADGESSSGLIHSLPEVYADACLNECEELAALIRPLLDCYRPGSVDPRSTSGN